MNGNTVGNGPQRRSPLRRLGIQAAAASAVALLAAACGGGDPASGVHSTTYQKELAFSQCMRTHGEPNFPDPGSNGAISIQGGGAPKGTEQRVGGSQMTKASNACRHLLPNGGAPTAAQQQHLLNQGLKFSKCMRAHGVPNFPDPSTANGPIEISGTGINPRSPQFQAAQRTCAKDLRGKGHGGLQIPT